MQRGRAQVQRVPIVEEETGAPCKGKGAGRRKEVEESRRKQGGAPYRGKCAARRVEKEFVGDIEEEG